MSCIDAECNDGDDVDVLYTTRLLTPLCAVLQTTTTSDDDAAAAAQRGDDFRDALTHVLRDVVLTTRRGNNDDDDDSHRAILTAVRRALLQLPPQTSHDASNNSSSNSSRHHDNATTTTSAAAQRVARALDRLFVLLSTTIVSAHLLTQSQPQGATSSALPAGVAHATRALAEGVFALPYALADTSTTATTTSSSITTATVAADDDAAACVRDVYFVAQVVLLQQLALRNGSDVAAWSAFFDDCRKQAASTTTRTTATATTTTAVADDATHASPTRMWRLSARHIDDVRRRACAALGDVTSELLQHTVARARFRRTALRFKSFYPHTIAQAPGSSGALVQLLLQFCHDWHAAVSARPLGSFSAALQRHLAALLDRNDDNDDDDAAQEQANATVDDGGDNGDDDDRCMSEAEHALLSLLDDYRVRWLRLLGDSGVHSYLVVTAVGSVLCARYILPQTRSSSGSSATSSAPSTSGATTAPRARATLASIQASGSHGNDVSSSRRSASSSDGSGSAALAMLEAASWLRVRASRVCDEVEWRVRAFAPLGLLFVLPQQQQQQQQQQEPAATCRRVCDMRLLLRPHLCHLATQLRIGLAVSHHVEGRQRFAQCALLCGLCDVATALAVYELAAATTATTTTTTAPTIGAAAHTVSNTTSAPATTTAVVSSVLARYTALVDRYAASAESELVLHTQSSQQQQQHATSSSLLLLHGERFCQMRYREPMPPPWPQFVAALHSVSSSEASVTHAAATTTTAAASDHSSAAAYVLQATMPCRFVLALLACRYHGLAARAIAHLLLHDKANVFLVSRDSLPPHGVSVQVYVAAALTRALQQQQQQDDNTTRVAQLERALRDLLPLLQLTQTYIASQSLLCMLLSRLVTLCRGDDADGDRTTRLHSRRRRRCLALVEALVVYFVLPCLRVLSPSHVVHAQLQRVLCAWQDAATAVGYGDGAAQFAHMRMWCTRLLPRSLLATSHARSRRSGTTASAATAATSSTTCGNDDNGDDVTMARVCVVDSLPSVRYAHDVLRTTELHALFLQALKRLNASRVAHYRQLLRPVLFAHPLFVAERVLQQAVGYENSFLRVHRQLLSRLPASCATLLLQLGLAYAQHYANALDGSSGGGGGGKAPQQQQHQGSRVGHVATFLAALCAEYARTRSSDNSSSAGNGVVVLLRAAEEALRRYSRAGLVLGLELLRALLYQCAHVRLEHEERFSDLQCRALAAAHTTRFFARGACESYRMTRWLDDDAQTSPRHLARTRDALAQALAQPCTCCVAAHDDDDDDSGERTTRPQTAARSLGQCLLLHVCRLHAQIYRLQADLEGTMDEVLLTSAKDADVLCDVVFALVSLQSHAAITTAAASSSSSATRQQAQSSLLPPQAMLLLVATPAMALCLTGRYNNNNDEASAWRWLARTSTAVPLSLLRTLSSLTARHFVYDDDVYAAALREVQACLVKAQSTQTRHAAATTTTTTTSHAGGDDMPSAVAAQRHARTVAQVERTVAWLRARAQCIASERAQHKALYDGYATQRRALWRELCAHLRKDSDDDDDSATVALAVSYLLPRTLLSYREALFVSALLTWLLQQQEEQQEQQNDTEVCGRVAVDLALCVVTAAATFVVGYTDGESARVGHLLAAIVTAAQKQQQQQQRTSCAQSNATMPSAAVLSYVQRHHQQQEQQRGSNGSAAATSPSRHAPRVVVASVTHADAAPPMRRFAALVEAATRATRMAQQQQHDDDDERKHSAQQAASMAAWPLQLEAYLTRFAAEVLQRRDDVPAHVQRNLLTMLSSVLRAQWPRTRAACTVLLRAVAPHADERLPNYASASAVLKTLRARAHAQRSTLAPLTLCAAQLAYRAGNNDDDDDSNNNSDIDEPAHVMQLQRWLYTQRLHDAYVQRLLADVAATGNGAVIDDNDDDDGGDNGGDDDKVADKDEDDARRVAAADDDDDGNDVDEHDDDVDESPREDAAMAALVDADAAAVAVVAESTHTSCSRSRSASRRSSSSRVDAALSSPSLSPPQQRDDDDDVSDDVSDNERTRKRARSEADEAVAAADGDDNNEGDDDEG